MAVEPDADMATRVCNSIADQRIRYFWLMLGDALADSRNEQGRTRVKRLISPAAMASKSGR